MASIIKVDNVQNQPGTNIVNKCGTTTTIGAGAGETINVCAATVNLGRCGGTVALAGGASQTGFGRTGTVNWNTTKITADPANAVSGTGYFCDTSGGGFTVTLPTSPSAGDIVAVSDYTGSFATYNLTIGRNSSNINGAASNFVIFQNDASAQFIYVDVTEGWRLVMTGSLSDVEELPTYVAATGGNQPTATGCIVCTNYKVHTFTGPGTFTVTDAGSPTGSNSVDYLVVAGGGSGGKYYGGGGGAGGYRESPGAASGCYTASPLGVSPAAAIAVSASPGSYSIAVGGGAAGVPGCNTPGLDGSVSTFDSITSAGGGGGGGAPPSSYADGRDGGSGGGGAYTSGSAGAGNTPSVTPPQGQPGGTPGGNSSGGGGALNAGPNCNSAAGGAGGGTEINPSPSYGTPGPSAPLRYFAGGGASAGGGGASVGGGGSRDAGPGAGSVNTGGGSAGNLSGGGGSGIVIIRYKFQ